MTPVEAVARAIRRSDLIPASDESYEVKARAAIEALAAHFDGIREAMPVYHTDGAPNYDRDEMEIVVAAIRAALA